MSHAVLDPLTESEGLIEVHALLHSTDYIVCLFDRTHGVIQQPLNLEISEGEELTVYIKSSGNACVHLTGFLIEEPIDTQWEGLPDDGFSLNDVEEDFEESTVIELSDEEDINLQYPDLTSLATDNKVTDSIEEKVINKKSITNLSEEKGNEKQCKRKRVSFDLDTGDNVKKNKRTTDDNTSIKLNAPHQKQTKGFTKTLSGGTITEELVYGHGKIAKNGRNVYIRYTGRVSGSGKIVDSVGKQEKPLCFELGKNEVMRGLDRGIRGMRIGGKRRITIPPSQRQNIEVPSTVPIDSDLVLDVELVNVQ